MKIVLPVVFILSFTSCFIEQPISEENPVNNKTYTVEYLFEHDGCKVYRFYDRGNYVYFTNCNGEAISTTDSTRVYNKITIKKQ